MGLATRQQLGAWYTPSDLVRRVVCATVTAEFVERCGDRPIRVLDPACGDGRFLLAAAERIAALGGRSELSGVDIDAGAVTAARSVVGDAHLEHADALRRDWAGVCVDVVVGNPPFLSQMSRVTTRGGSSERGGGPYADAAAEFLALAADVVDPIGGRVGFVLPQSLLAARDAGAIRRRIDERAQMTWWWSSPERQFDAHVHTCAIVLDFGAAAVDTVSRRGPNDSWSHVVTAELRVPPPPSELDDAGALAGVLGDRASLNANFRDEYYGMVPAVGDHPGGPRLITSGLIDPLHNRWGDRPIRFAKQRFERPRLDLALLDPKMRAWADRRLVPKVLIANQTQILEAIVDVDGSVLPGVPVVAAYPADGGERAVCEIAAVLTSPAASAWAWARSAGTGLSANAIRVGPVVLADLPWPGGDLSDAIDAVRAGDARSCARAVHRAYGVAEAGPLFDWWERSLVRIEARS